MRRPDEGTRYSTIHKDPASFVVAPNLLDYSAVSAGFSWQAARARLSGLPQRAGLNIAFEAVDRHARGPGEKRVALRWIGKLGETRDFTYGDLALSTNRFANSLRSLRVKAGDRAYVLLGRIPELYIAVLGALKTKCVVSPLFSAFSPEPIATRMEIGGARILIITDEAP